MISKKEFDLLFLLYRKPGCSQREIASRINCSIGTVNGLIQKLRAQTLIEDNRLTQKGLSMLEPYRVDNAIIMAAGMSSRFAPLSYEQPKGVLKVKGEILIERQIKQLKEAGIDEITIVVGYMKEEFFYLEEKFGVKIVVNDDYYRYNNPSTLMRVQNELRNTYICSSDNYFSENVFEPYVYRSYYSAVMIPGASNEYGLILNNKGRITGVNHAPKDMLCMLGHVYFSADFSKKFIEILNREYEIGNTKYELWEKLLERHLDELEIYVRKYDDSTIFEFDSLEELRSFDSKYLKNTGSKIFKNICSVLNCEEDEITDIEVIKQGLTNLSFRFRCKNNEYVYRHPGVGTNKYISRESEAFSLTMAKRLDLDDTLVSMSENEGWKLSRFICDAKTLDYHNETEVQHALNMMRRLHQAKIVSEFDFNIWGRTETFIEKIKDRHDLREDFLNLYESMKRLYKYVVADNVPWILCHCDCYSPNFLIDKAGKMTLIDWEYSGNDDPANDLGTFICCSDYNYEEAINVLKMYHGELPEKKVLRHEIAYIAIAAFYWYNWALYQESIGNIVGEYLLLWYQNTKMYMKKALQLYREEL